MATLAQVVEELTSSKGDLDLIAKFSLVNAEEVAAALLAAESDSAEGFALRLLAKYNPVVVVVTSKKSKS
jgi:NACalpha-BTF3-like transcription factor